MQVGLSSNVLSATLVHQRGSYTASSIPKSCCLIASAIVIYVLLRCRSINRASVPTYSVGSGLLVHPLTLRQLVWGPHAAKFGASQLAATFPETKARLANFALAAQHWRRSTLDRY